MTRKIEQQTKVEDTDQNIENNNIVDTTKKEVKKHKKNTVQIIKDKAVHFFAEKIKKFKEIIMGKEEKEAKEAEETLRVISSVALEKCYSHIYETDTNAKVSVIFSGLSDVFCEKEKKESDQAYEKRKRELGLAYFLGLSPEGAKQHIQEYMLLAQEAEKLLGIDIKDSIEENQKVYNEIYAIHESFTGELEKDNSNRENRSIVRSNQQSIQTNNKLGGKQSTNMHTTRMPNHNQKAQEIENKDYTRLKEKRVLDPHKMEAIADKYESKKNAEGEKITYCSRTARENAFDIFKTHIPSGNAYDATKERPLGKYTHTKRVDKKNSPISLPDYGETLYDSYDTHYMTLDNPSEKYPATIIDIGVWSNSIYGHRACGYFDFSRNERMVLDPYRAHSSGKKRESTEPIPYTDYVKKNNVFCARFYTSDYIVGQPQSDKTPKTNQKLAT